MNVLLVSTTASWLAQARMPRALAMAGFRVSLLAPPESVGAKSRFVARYDALPEEANRAQWEVALAQAVDAAAPRLVVPCDDMATNLLQALALAPALALSPATALALAALARESLGDPKHYRSSTDKTLLPQAAAAAGVRVPRTEIVDDANAAAAIADALGYPVVLKRGHGAAGAAVAVVGNRGELAAAFARLLSLPALFVDEDSRRILVQEFVHGKSVSRASVAWDTGELAGVTRERVVRHPAHTGPGSTVRIYFDAAARAASQALSRVLGMRGFFSIEYVIHPHSGEAYLLEINRRAPPGIELGSAVGVDLCKPLYATLTGAAAETPADVAPGFERVIAQFPQEWLRDPGSAYLRDCPSDAPWDDPEVFEAMLRLRHME
jgi:glutathione synthase/RimK-type ligase-like ATP-grasp enzyme